MNISSVVKDGIEEWLGDKPARSLSMLARLSKISYATVRRAAQGEADLNFNTAIALCDVIFSRSKMREVIAMSFPHVTKLALEHYWPKPENESLYDFLASKDHFPVMMLASNEGGTTKEEIASVFGRKASLPTEQLLDATVLREINGRIVLSQDAVGITSKAVARTNLSAMLDAIDPGNDEIPYTSNAYTYTQGLNEDAVKKADEIIKDAHDKLYELLSDTKNHGNILWFSGVLSNVLVNGDKLK